MSNQLPNGSSKAGRLGYRAGRFLLKAFRRWGKVKRSAVEHAGGVYGQVGRVGAFIALSATELGCLILLLLINMWLLAVALLIGVAFLASWFNLYEGATAKEDDPGPDHLAADFYLGDYDDNGHYIGHFKSPSRFPSE